MHNYVREGVFFSIFTPSMRFYDLKAMSIDGTLFVSRKDDVRTISGPMPEHECDEVLDACRQAIAEDEKAGFGDRVAQLHVPPVGAAIFCHRDYITREHVINAHERIGSVTFPGVVFNDRVLTLKVLPDIGDRVLTADRNGWRFDD